MGTVGQCRVTGTGALMHQTRPALHVPKVQSNPNKVTKGGKLTFDKSIQWACAGRIAVERILCQHIYRVCMNKREERLRETESQRKLHSQTKATVEESETAEEAIRMSSDCSATYERTLRQLKLQHNQALGNLTTEMESERILLEEKISKLTQKIAGLRQNSREHQTQLQDLQKENAMLRQEITNLEGHLKVPKAPEMCEKCQSLEIAIEEKILQLTETENVVEELQCFCRKFCKRLTQQDQLLAVMSMLKRPR